MSKEPTNGSPHFRAVILDYGQVLAHRPSREEFGRMAEMFNVSFDVFHSLWEASRGPYDRGDFTAEDYWMRLAAETSTTLSPEQIELLRKIEVEIWCHLDPVMLDWVAQLHRSALRTALLSNMPWDLVHHVRNCSWMENFSCHTLSAEVRAIKPDPIIYEHTLRCLGVAAPETLFVDDRQPNVSGALALGIRAVQFHSIAQLTVELERLGFPILPTDKKSSPPAASVLPSKRPGREVKSPASE